MNEQTRNEIVRRSLSGQSQRSIARQLGMSRPTVRRVIEQYHRRRDEAGADCPELPRKRASRRSLLDPFRNTVGQLLARYPNITITRLLEELRAGGYQGGYTILRQYIRTVRGPSAKALVERFETAPGVQAQMDWSTYDIDFTAEGGDASSSSAISWHTRGVNTSISPKPKTWRPRSASTFTHSATSEASRRLVFTTT